MEVEEAFEGGKESNREGKEDDKAVVVGSEDVAEASEMLDELIPGTILVNENTRLR